MIGFSFEQEGPTTGEQRLQSVDSIQLQDVRISYGGGTEALSDVSKTLHGARMPGQSARRATTVEPWSCSLWLAEPTSRLVIVSRQPLDSISEHDWASQVSVRSQRPTS